MTSRATKRAAFELLASKPPKQCKRSFAAFCLLLGLLTGVLALRFEVEDRDAPGYNFVDRAYMLQHMDDEVVLENLSVTAD